MNPAPVPSVVDQSGVLEDAKVEREPGLGGVQGALELTDATFPALQQLNQGEAGLVGEGVEKLDGARGAGRCRNHDCNISTFIDLARAAESRATRARPRNNSSRAGDRTRTGDVQLGKLAFYQLNYARKGAGTCGSGASQSSYFLAYLQAVIPGWRASALMA